MKRVLAVLLVLGALMLLWMRNPATPDQQPDALPAPAPASVSRSPAPAEPAPLLGDTILENYAQPDQPPERDLATLAGLMENSLILSKGAAGRPLSANEEWARLLRGADGTGERYLSDQHPALNADGQLVDRWGSPLFFHAVGQGRFELRSAGPDRILWTEDDLHRNSDGTLRRGPDLNPPSLVDASAK